MPEKWRQKKSFHPCLFLFFVISWDSIYNIKNFPRTEASEIYCFLTHFVLYIVPLEPLLQVPLEVHSEFQILNLP